MRVAPLPEIQESRNNRIIRRLRRLAAAAWLLMLASLVIGGLLYMRGPVAATEPELLSADSGASIGIPLLIAADMVLCSCDGPQDAVVVANRERTVAHKVRTAQVNNGLAFSLYRLQVPLAFGAKTPTVVEESQLLIASEGGTVWQGTVKNTTATEIRVDPKVNLQQGLPVYLQADRTALVGVTVAVSQETRILPIAAVLASFPEVTGSK